MVWKLARNKKFYVGLLIISFFALFPLSVWLADPLFTHPFPTGQQFQYPILLIWPAHVEIRLVTSIAEVSPRPANAGYTFIVPADRQAWVETEVRNTRAPRSDAAWDLRVDQLGGGRQRIRLELLGDGVNGIIYEARPDEIVPLASRLTGPFGAYTILAVHLLVWGVCCFLVSTLRRVARRDLNSV